MITQLTEPQAAMFQCVRDFLEGVKKMAYHSTVRNVRGSLDDVPTNESKLLNFQIRLDMAHRMLAAGNVEIAVNSIERIKQDVLWFIKEVPQNTAADVLSPSFKDIPT